MNYSAKGRSSDLLPVYRLPFHYKLESGLEWQTVVELTAAGQFRIYTVFPFNSEALPTETKSGANIGFWLFSCLFFLFLVHWAFGHLVIGSLVHWSLVIGPLVIYSLVIGI